MHKKANKIRDALGHKGWDFDNKDSIEEEVLNKEGRD